MVKQIYALILAGVIFFVPKGFSDCCFEFAGEWLYTLSAIDQPYYAINEGAGASLFNGKRVANDQEWHSGYRLEASYHYAPCDTLCARWTHFPNFSDAGRDDQLNNAILINPGTVADNVSLAQMCDEFDFYVLDILYQRGLYCSPPFILGLDIGVQFAHLDTQEEFLYSIEDFIPFSSTIENQAKLRGVGPELGFQFSYSLFNCLNINGRGSSALLISKKGTKARQQETIGILDYSTGNEDYWIATPSFNGRLGLGYDHLVSCGCFCGQLNLEVGYEIIHLIRGVDRIFFTQNGDNTGSSITQTMDFTLHGPYVHLGICF